MKSFVSMLIISWCCCSTAVVSANSKKDEVSSISTVSYSVKYRQAQRLLEAIKPLYPEQFLSVVGDKVFIRGDAATSAEAIAVLQEMDQPERYFRLRLSPTKPSTNSKLYSTKQSLTMQNQSFAMTDNKPLLISKRSDSQRLSAGALLWYQTETVVDEEHTITFNVRALTAEKAELSYRIRYVNQGEQQTQLNTVVVTFNEWQPLFGSASTTHWSTQAAAQPNSIFIKLETY